MGAVVAPVNLNPQESQTTLPDIQLPLPIRPPRWRRHAAQVPWHAARALAGAGGWNLAKAAQALKEMKGLCGGGQMVPLQDTILPLPKQLSARYTKQIERIPLLSLPTLLAGNDLGSWGFLREFGIIQAETLEIYMAVLASLSRGTGAVDPVGLCQLYGDINLQCMTGPREQTDFVRQFSAMSLSSSSPRVTARKCLPDDGMHWMIPMSWGRRRTCGVRSRSTSSMPQLCHDGYRGLCHPNPKHIQRPEHSQLCRQCPAERLLTNVAWELRPTIRLLLD